jgi:hypothetical protein
LLLALLLLLVSLLLLASRQWQAFLLLLAFFKFLMVSCSWSLCFSDVPGVAKVFVGFSAIPFEHAVAGGPPVAGGPGVTGFPAVEGVLAVANNPANPGVHILAGGLTYWIVE